MIPAEYVPWLVAGAVVVAFVLFKRLGQVSGEQARALVKQGAKLVDVRTKAEFSSGHLPGAVNIPVAELGSKLASLGPKERPVVVYCASGARSAVARSVLKGQGFAQVFNLGAMGRWGAV